MFIIKWKMIKVRNNLPYIFNFCLLITILIKDISLDVKFLMKDNLVKI
jgi:hypothetical protein